MRYWLMKSEPDEFSIDDQPPAVCREILARLDDAIMTAGRTPERVRRSVLVAWPVGPMEEVPSLLDAYLVAGVQRIFFMLPERAFAIAALERMAKVCLVA